MNSVSFNLQYLCSFIYITHALFSHFEFTNITQKAFELNVLNNCVCVFPKGEPAEQVEPNDQWEFVHLLLAHAHEARFHHYGRSDGHAYLPDNHRGVHPPVRVLLLQPASHWLPDRPRGAASLAHHYPHLCVLLLPLISASHRCPLQPPATVTAHYPSVAPAVTAPTPPPAPTLPPLPRRTGDTVRDTDATCAHAGPYLTQEHFGTR